MNIPFRPLLYQSGAPEASLRQFTNGVLSFIFFCKITDENGLANDLAHILSFIDCVFRFPAIVKDFT